MLRKLAAQPERSEGEQISIIVLYAVIIPMSLLGNSLFIVVVTQFRKPLSATETCLQHLALSDILLALSHIFFLAQALDATLTDSKVAYFIYFLNQAAFSACVLLLMDVALHQRRSITGPRDAPISRRCLFAQILITWALALLSSLPDAFVRWDKMNNRTQKFNYTMKSLGIFTFSLQQLLTFLLPLVTITVCYFAVLRTVCQTSIRRRRHVYRMIAALLTVFYIFQLPRAISYCLEFYQPSISNSEITYLLSSISCVINPIIYAVFWQKFRNHTKNLFAQRKCLKRSGLSSVQLETSST